MKKLSLDQLKEKVTVLNDSQKQQSISGGESLAYWMGYAVGSAVSWIDEQLDELFED